jgi:hypothetical protein
VLHLGGVAGLLFLAFWVFCLLDVIATDETLTRNLPKVAWLIVVIILPTVGGVAWLLLGRPERTTFTPGSTTYRRARPAAPLGPDDAEDFLRDLDERRRREDED